MDQDLPEKDSHEQFIRRFLQAERDLLRSVMSLIPNAADARDVVQEAAVALWQKFDQYDPNRPFVAWASRFALNEARMFLRSQSRRKRLAEDVVDLLVTQRAAAAERLDARREYLGECLGSLPKEQTELVRARYFDESNVTQLSERFERSVEAIYKSLQRIRRALQECIERKVAMEGES